MSQLSESAPFAPDFPGEVYYLDWQLQFEQGLYSGRSTHARAVNS